MSWPWLEAEQSFEPSTLPGALGNLPHQHFSLWQALLPLALPERVWMEQTNRKGGQGLFIH